MKKALIVALLVGLVAAPAMAGLVPNPPTRVGNFTASPFGDVAERGFPYDANNPADVYDNGIYISGFSNGPSTFYAGGIITLAAGVFMCDDVTLAPGATAIGTAGTGSGGIDWVFNNYYAGPGSHNVTIAFFSNPGGNDTSLGATIAAFSFGGGVPNGYYLLSAGLPLFATPGDLWVCIAHSVTTRHFFSGPAGNSDTDPGSANPAVTYNGSSDNLMLVLSTAGATLLTGGSAPAEFDTNWALQGTFIPEPATAAILVLGGLVALRRRKA
jgi:hypothetical protein